MDRLLRLSLQALEECFLSGGTCEVYNKLTKKQVIFCGMSDPLLPDELVQNTKNLYYRFHGVPELYTSKYDAEILHHFADEVEGSGTTENAFIYFNNDIGGSAIENAIEMQNYCKAFA